MNLILPIEIRTGKKPFKCNLNIYRNCNRFRLGSVKKEYTKIVHELCLPPVYECFSGPVDLLYTLYMPTRRKCDVANICSIIDKFTCDALIKAHVLVDDNYDYIKSVKYSWGGVDKELPRCELFIKRSTSNV